MDVSKRRLNYGRFNDSPHGSFPFRFASQMRTLITLVVCLAVGFGLALYQHKERVYNVQNYKGASERLVQSAQAMEGALDTEIEQQLAEDRTKASKRLGKIEVIGGPELDFGIMMRGTKRAHKFVFKNVGTGDVDLEYKSSTCKCTVGKLDRTTLAPGATVDVELEWRADSQFDDFSQTATIASTANNQEEIKLTIHGIVGEAYIFDPPSYSFGDFLSQAGTTLSGSIYSFEADPPNISSASVVDATMSKRIHVDVKEAQKLEFNEVPRFADAKYKIDFDIHFLPGIPAGPLTANIGFARHNSDLSGSGDNTELLRYTLKGRSVAPVRVVASSDYNEERNIFNLGAAKSSVGIKKSLLLAVRGKEEAESVLRVVRVVPAGVLKVTIGEPRVSPTQKIYPVTIEIPPGTDPIELDGTFSKDFGKIELETKIENLEEMQLIPMYVKFRITD